MVVRRFGSRFGVKCTDAFHDREKIPDAPAHLGLVHQSVTHGPHQFVATVSCRPGHLEVETGNHSFDGRVRPEPVAHHHAVETPLVTQHLGEQPTVIGRVQPVHLVVCGHHRHHTRVTNGTLEGDEVDLAQRAHINLRVDRHAFELGVVAHEVLDAARDTLGLHPPHVSHGHFSGEVGIFTH